ncbi:hypothetical protein N7540_003173 [Penicillium herquei]|nr:hypothetical protein N7540_003173 [Penicillium herquei]
MENPPSKPPGPIFVDHLINQLSQFQAPEHTIEDIPRTQHGTQLEEKPPNPLSALPTSQLTQVKPLMLTIHSLFPNDLLPALDILDRGLVQRFIREDRVDNPSPSELEHSHSQDQEMTMNPSQPLQQNTNTNAAKPEDIFFVISASSAPLPRPPGTSSPSTPANVPTQQTQTQEQIKGYEVRLHAWNCTCPTFTLSAFRDLSRLNRQFEYPSAMHMADSDQSGDLYPYPFGGTLTSPRDRASPPICKHILACLLFIRCPGLFGGCGDGRCIISKEELAGWCAGWGG